jgi:hypothetical protein
VILLVAFISNHHCFSIETNIIHRYLFSYYIFWHISFYFITLILHYFCFFPICWIFWIMVPVIYIFVMCIVFLVSILTSLYYTILIFIAYYLASLFIYYSQLFCYTRGFPRYAQNISILDVANIFFSIFLQLFHSRFYCLHVDT